MKIRNKLIFTSGISALLVIGNAFSQIPPKSTSKPPEINLDVSAMRARNLTQAPPIHSDGNGLRDMKEQVERQKKLIFLYEEKIRFLEEKIKTLENK